MKNHIMEVVKNFHHELQLHKKLIILKVIIIMNFRIIFLQDWMMIMNLKEENLCLHQQEKDRQGNYIVMMIIIICHHQILKIFEVIKDLVEKDYLIVSQKKKELIIL